LLFSVEVSRTGFRKSTVELLTVKRLVLGMMPSEEKLLGVLAELEVRRARTDRKIQRIRRLLRRAVVRQRGRDQRCCPERVGPDEQHRYRLLRVYRKF
jgi:hypothetical protein